MVLESVSLNFIVTISMAIWSVPGVSLKMFVIDVVKEPIIYLWLNITLTMAMAKVF